MQPRFDSAAVAILWMACAFAVGQSVRVRNGCGTGEELVQMSAAEQHANAMGFVNGLLDASLLGAAADKLKWLDGCIVVDCASTQWNKLIPSHLTEHPEKWHLPATILSYEALAEVCSQKAIR